jgi:hypothetical protein
VYLAKPERPRSMLPEQRERDEYGPQNDRKKGKGKEAKVFAAVHGRLLAVLGRTKLLASRIFDILPDDSLLVQMIFSWLVVTRCWSQLSAPSERVGN